jgi:hypothetical protein
MQKGAVGCGAFARLEIVVLAAYFADSPKRKVANFSGRYVDKMDDIWTENHPSKRSEEAFCNQEGR